MSCPASVRTARCIYQGDDYSLTVTFVDDDGDPVDVSTSTWRSAIKFGDGTPVMFDIDVTDADTGVLVFSLDSTTTEGLTPGRYAWDVEENTGALIRTLLRGTAVVREEVTPNA